MTRRAGTAFFVAAFALLPWAVEACGRAANVLESDPGTEDFPDDAHFSTGGIGGSGGRATGGVRRTGGAGGGVGPIVPPPAGGGPSAGGGPGTGDPGDPNAEVRRKLIEELCAIPTRFPCLTLVIDDEPLGAASEDHQQQCRERTELGHDVDVGPDCWDQFYAHANCVIEKTDYCPCDADAGSCWVVPRVHVYSSACADTYKMLIKCTTEPHTVSGPAGVFTWAQNDDECFVQGVAQNGIDTLGSMCSRIAGAFDDCECLRNGMTIGIFTLPTGAGCKTVAERVAGGACGSTQTR